jgi:nucleotide-binding universal stress UspA family protein
MKWPPERILVGTDFSETARAAAEVAGDFARRTNARLHVVHCVRDPAQLITGYEVIDELLRGRSDPGRLKHEASARLAAYAGELGLREADLRTVLGDPAAEILALRAMLGVDLVALGAGHLRGIRGLLLGSVADRVLRNPGCPLLLVRRPPAGGTFRRVLVCAERTDRADLALELSAPLLRDLPSDFLVLHVLPPAGYLSDERQVVIAPEKEAERLSQAVRLLSPDLAAQVTVRRGDPAHEIPEAARELEADLVVLGARRHPDGWPGRVTDRVARADLPAVLVVWPPASATEPSR